LLHLLAQASTPIERSAFKKSKTPPNYERTKRSKLTYNVETFSLENLWWA